MTRRPLPYLATLGLAAFLPLSLACSKSDGSTAGAAGDSTTQASSQSGGQSDQEPLVPDTVRDGQPAKPATVVDPKTFPEVVARVGDRPIRRSDLINAARQAASQRAMSGSPPPPATLDFFKEVLDGLVVREILYADATAQGLTADKAEVDRRLASLKSRFTDPKEFAEALAQEGFTPETLEENARVTLTVDRLVAEKYAPGVTVAESAVRAYYDAHPEQMKIPERRRIRHILIKPEGETPADKEKARKLAGDVLARLGKGEDFAALAKQYSADPGSKGQGGELPPLGQGETVPPFEKAAWSLEKGGRSGIVETQFGFHILELLEIIPPGQVPFDQARPRLEQVLRQRNLQKAVRARVDELRQKTKVDILI